MNPQKYNQLMHIIVCYVLPYRYKCYTCLAIVVDRLVCKAFYDEVLRLNRQTLGNGSIPNMVSTVSGGQMKYIVNLDRDKIFKYKPIEGDITYLKSVCGDLDLPVANKKTILMVYICTLHVLINPLHRDWDIIRDIISTLNRIISGSKRVSSYIKNHLKQRMLDLTNENWNLSDQELLSITDACYPL